MFTSYEIRKENNKEVLYLYVDISNEFSINLNKIKNNLEESIKDFIKDNNILFKGTLVTLIIGGTTALNVVLNNDTYKNNIKDNVSINYNISSEELNNLDVIDNIEELSEEELDLSEIQDSEYIIDNNEEVYSVQEPKKEIIDEVKIESHEDVKIDTQENNNLEEPIKEEVIDNNIYVNIRRSSGEFETLELEEYLIGCVGAEMPAAFNKEALKSQAIIARTYALKAIKEGRVITDNESTQSYKSNIELMNMWGSSYDTYYNKIKNSVDETKGMYLSYNGNYIEAVYHSTSNGITESSVNIWGNYYPYLVNVSSEFDSDSPTYIQEKFITYEELSLKLNIDVNQDTDFNILDRTSGNRVKEISVGTQVFNGNNFRNTLSLRSADFDIEKTDIGIIFTTRGYGHGVGLSQYGANGMAKRGYNYYEILMHYYPNTTINNL